MLNENNPAIQWRLCIAFQILAPLLLILGSNWLPESPRYLIYYRRLDEGLQVLKQLHSSVNDTTHQPANEEFSQIQRQIELDRERELPWLALWKKPNTRKRLLFGFLAIAVAKSSGVLVSSAPISKTTASWPNTVCGHRVIGSSLRNIKNNRLTLTVCLSGYQQLPNRPQQRPWYYKLEGATVTFDLYLLGLFHELGECYASRSGRSCETHDDWNGESSYELSIRTCVLSHKNGKDRSCMRRRM